MARAYDIDDHTPEVKRLISEAIEQGLEKIGIAAEGYAKLKCPTSPHGGRLKNSITHAVSMQDEAVYIGTDVKYAPYVELGTGKYIQGGRTTPWRYKDEEGNWHTTTGQKPQPFLRPAATEHIDEYQRLMENSLKS